MQRGLFKSLLLSVFKGYPLDWKKRTCSLSSTTKNFMAPPQDHVQLHFILVPLMSQGHLIPLVDMARLFAQRGVTVTIVTTPLNTLRVKTNIDRAIESGLPIQILEIRFPCEEAGMPEGYENMDTLPSHDMAKNFFVATRMMKEPLEEYLGEIKPVPSCIISDAGLPWTSETANKFQIPRLIFHGTGCLSLLCSHNLLVNKVHESVTSDSEVFVVPDLPDRIEVTKAHLPGAINQCLSNLQELHNQIREVERRAYGVVVNSFYHLESKYVDEYHKVRQNKAWCIGPVSLCNKEVSDMAERGNKASIDGQICLKWLDSWESNSVVYVCLGSLCRLLPSQLIEIGLGLEASKHPFIWVIKSGNKDSELDKWFVEDKFEERTKNRGLIIKGWAPQVLILSHPAIGGFLTHCGWNSTLEGVCAGVPMITWPMFAEQFFNEKLIVQVLGVGIKVGVDHSVQWGNEEKIGVLMKEEEIEKVVRKLMDESEEGEIRRTKARELQKMARRAVEEGGSSHLSITLLIQDIMHQAIKKLNPEGEKD